jgi:hypothetical protein
LAVLLAAGCVEPAPVARTADRPSGPFTHLVCPALDPARPLEGCNVRATAANGPANEVALALDPANPLHLALAAKAYNETRLLGPPPVIGDVLLTTAASFDGGLTWVETYPSPLTPLVGSIPVGQSQGWQEDDPAIAIASDGGVVAGTIRLQGFGDEALVFYRSADGGRTFPQRTMIPMHPQPDKPAMALDPSTGALYAAYNGPGGFAASRDGGRTWNVTALCACVDPFVDVARDGTVYVSGFASFADGGIEVRVARSTDGGATWTQPVVVAPTSGRSASPVDNLRLYRAPNGARVAVDKGAGPRAGTVYVVWADHPPGAPSAPCVSGTCFEYPDWDVFLSRSADGGATWSAPQRVNDDSVRAASQILPTIAVSPKGDVHVAWLDQRSDPSGLTMSAAYAHSADGVHFDRNLVVSDLPTPVALSHHQSPTFAGFVGDYIGLQASDERAVVAFPDTRYGRADIEIAIVE